MASWAQAEIHRTRWPNLPSGLAPLQGPTVPSVGRKFLVDGDRILKVGADESEGTMTAFARSNLSEVVPAVRDFVETEDGHTVLVTQHMPGQPLRAVWPSLDPGRQEVVKRNLADLLVRMRSLTYDYFGRPGGEPYVLAQALGPQAYVFCPTYEVWQSSRVQAFRSHSTEPLPLHAHAAHDGQHRAVLTHGDLSDGNILVDAATLEITGLIDWETANVAPSYFEYVCARLSGGHLPGWRRVILDVLTDVLRRECEAEEGHSHWERYERALDEWRRMVDVERIAQGLDQSCYWTYEDDDLPSAGNTACS